MFNRRLVALVGLALIWPASSYAQGSPAKPPPLPMPPPNRLDRQGWWRNFDREVHSRGEQVQLLTKPADVASCLAKRAKSSAGRLVGGPLTNDERYQALTQALSGKYKECAPSVRIPLFYIGGALAEELVRKERPTLAERISPSEAAAAKAFYASSAGVTMDSLGRCLAANSPGLTYLLLANPAGDQRETAALNGLYAQTPECGQSAPPVGIGTAEQRSAIAAGLYHWLHRT